MGRFKELKDRVRYVTSFIKSVPYFWNKVTRTIQGDKVGNIVSINSGQVWDTKIEDDCLKFPVWAIVGNEKALTALPNGEYKLTGVAFENIKEYTPKSTMKKGYILKWKKTMAVIQHKGRKYIVDPKYIKDVVVKSHRNRV